MKRKQSSRSHAIGLMDKSILIRRSSLHTILMTTKIHKRKVVQKVPSVIVNKKISLQNTLSKKFKEFKPQPTHIEDELALNPRFEKEMEIEKQNIESKVFLQNSLLIILFRSTMFMTLRAKLKF